MASMDLWAALLIGLMGGSHCLGMCGGLMTAVALQSPQRRPSLLLSYNLGRISSYMLAGALVAGLGSLLGNHGWQFLRLFAAIMLILMGLYIAGWWAALTHLERWGQRLWRHISPYTRKLLPVRHNGQALLLGICWGWLPCGLVYSTLSWSLSSGSSVEGALLMGAFGLGTLPSMLATGWFAQQMKGWMQKPWLRRLSGLIIIAWGLYSLRFLLHLH
ncbi:sulfite exporter TauE/SafE family protein [Balneatrix alpica]|uniref:sulfite exporter TauE/SafE family protein n=1 Tax=Balneatrix alpica TaxID=75684 RepID=UPI002738BF53|nr:sulfite exporter TauE/SafE family protein [Balneatrix alpica]